jgi:hypothetical protein
MKANSKAATTMLALSLVVGVCALQANAACGGLTQPVPGSLFHQQNWEGATTNSASFKLVSTSDEAAIVGFWKVTFSVSGTVIDSGYAQWHSDGTEFMNSGALAPATQNFCMGVWKKVGDGNYKLNHFALTYDLNGNPTGTANIREQVKVGQGAKTYAGSFTIDLYDLNGNLLAHVAGDVTGSRITVDTPPNA